LALPPAYRFPTCLARKKLLPNEGKGWFISSVFFSGFTSKAQQLLDPQQVIADIVEELSANTDVEQDYSELVEDLLQLADDPLNLNAARKVDLQKLFFLSDFQIESLLSYRDSSAKYLAFMSCSWSLVST